MSTPARASAASHPLGLVVLEDRPGDDPQPDRLAVDEVAAGDPLEVVEEEVVDALDVARVPARVVERRAAPAVGEDQGPDPGLGAVADLVERVDDRSAITVAASSTRRWSYGQRGSVRPSRSASCQS